MPFSRETKASVFTRSARICNICYKRCGTNIEVVHIVAEADGGPNDESNAIPLCLDCHQETGAYDNRHPKGNKFTAKELHARRDHLYKLVESGALAARVVAFQSGGNRKAGGKPPSARRLAAPPAPSAEGLALIRQALADENPSAPGAKLRIVGDFERVSRPVAPG